MNVILAGKDTGIVDALEGAPWYVHLGAAAALGLSAYGLTELARRRNIDSELLNIVQLFLAFAAFFLAMQGIFGDS